MRFRDELFRLLPLGEQHGRSRECQHLNSANDLFAHPFLNFGISAMRSFIEEMIENLHINDSDVKEVTLFVCFGRKVHAGKKNNKRNSNQTKPSPGSNTEGEASRMKKQSRGTA